MFLVSSNSSIWQFRWGHLSLTSFLVKSKQRRRFDRQRIPCFRNKYIDIKLVRSVFESFHQVQMKVWSSEFEFFTISKCFFTFVYILVEFRSTQLPDNNKIGRKNKNRVSEKLDFFNFLFKILKKLIVLQKLDTLRIQNLCINPRFILGAWGASSWKVWHF